MKICKYNCHGYKQVSDEYNLIDVNTYTNKELVEDNLIITKAMSIEKCNTKEELKENLVEIINNINENEHINKMERMIRIVLNKKLGKDETNSILERINDKKKGLYDMLTVLDRIEMNEKKIREQDRKKALKEGMNKTKIEIAKELLKDKIDIDKISKWTKISKSELEKMKNKKEEY